MADAFRVDAGKLADAVTRMTEFGRCAEILRAGVESAVESLHATWTGEGAPPRAPRRSRDA